MANKSITSVIENHIPLFIRLQYPNFVEFIKLYYADQEQVGSSYEFIANLLDYSNIDLTSIQLLDSFSKQYIKTLPKNILPEINKRTLIKYAREFYQSVGSESSIRFLFRILFNEHVDLYYPSVDIIRTSYGKWQVEKIIKITNTRRNNDIISIEGTEIVGQTSGARGLVEKVNVYTATNGADVAEISLTDFDSINPISNFIPKETVVATSLDGDMTFSEIVYYIISDINITNGGMYNREGDLIKVISTVGSDAAVRVDSVEDGSIDSIEIINPGDGYLPGDLIFFEESRTSIGARAIITEVDSIDSETPGPILTIKLIDKGHSYKEIPTYEIRSEAGEGAILYPISSSIGKIKTINIINHGVRYSPEITNSFPLQFPIYFGEAYELGSLQFYKTAFVYDSAWNEIDYNKNETIVGSISGAEANIIRFDKNTGILTYELLPGSINFQVDDIITGQSTTATGYIIHQLWSVSSEIIPGALGEYKGRFLNRDGFLSSDKYLQDSYYYQDFSYVITTTRPKDEWFNYIKPNVHPAGTIAFGFGESFEIIKEGVLGGFVSPTLESVRYYIDEYDYDETRWTPQLYGERLLAQKPNTQKKDYKVYEDFFIESGSIDQLVLDDNDTILLLDEEPSNDNFLIMNDEPLVYKDINTSIKAHLCFGSKIVYDIEGEFGLGIDDIENTFSIDDSSVSIESSYTDTDNYTDNENYTTESETENFLVT
jgi:hypothetical protein